MRCLLVALPLLVGHAFTHAVAFSAEAVVSPYAATHTYEVKIRFDGKVSTTQVQASDAGHAKKLVQAQYGPKVTVLGVKKID